MMPSLIRVAVFLQSVDSARIHQGIHQETGAAEQLQLTPIQDFKHNPGLGLSSEFVASGSPITLTVVEDHKILAFKHSHYSIYKEDGTKLAFMRSKFNVLELLGPVTHNCDWDLLPADRELTGQNSNMPHKGVDAEAKKKRIAKGKAIMFPWNPTYFNKAYITTPNLKPARKQTDADIYYTFTHLNPISKELKNFTEAHIRVTEGWCTNSGRKCKTAFMVYCSFLHLRCTISKEGKHVGDITRVENKLHLSLERGLDANKVYVVTVTEGDALMFAQLAGFMDLTHNNKRLHLFGGVLAPVIPNAIEATKKQSPQRYGGKGGKAGRKH